MRNSSRRLLLCFALAATFCTTVTTAHARPEGQTINLGIDSNSDGKPPIFEGVGAVSGGGATSVLLKDYPQKQRAEILDLLFKPNFGASMQTLYVEVGGDGNSTQGTEQSFMRTRNEENFSRGYEWWLMKEATVRNPDLTLDACAWACPSWIGDGEFWSKDMADYYAKWIIGAKKIHGLTIDAIGCRNEKGVALDWVKLFRRTLNDNGLKQVRIHAFDNAGDSKWDWCKSLGTDPELAAAVDIIGNHTVGITPQPSDIRPLAKRLNKPIWNTEEHVYNGEGRNYASDYDCMIGAVHLFNDGFISQGVTKIVNWYLCGSTYGCEPYADQPPAMIARSPWSGHYSIKPIVWAYAHYGQFTKIGWQYIDGGCVALEGGGTAVSLKSPDGKDFSIIVETAGAKAPQTVKLKIAPGLPGQAMCVWRSTKDDLFSRQEDAIPADDRTITLTFAPDAVYSISTTKGQQKGGFADVPAEKAFPFPYADDFEGYGDPKQWGYLPHYTADVSGVFELADRPDHQGKCLRQVVAHKSNSWAPEWIPYTVLGDDKWTDYEVTADLYFDNDGSAGLIGRVSSTGDGWNGDPNAYYARIYSDGGCSLHLADQRLKGSHDRQLAVGNIDHWNDDWKKHRWHRTTLRFQGDKITLLADGVEVLSATDRTFTHGMAGLMSGGEDGGRNTACFDNLRIDRPNAVGEPPRSPSLELTPMYSR